MRFDAPLIPATMIKRYKRFLADVRLEDGSELTVHCPNSGSMKMCWAEGWPVYISDSGNAKRKHRHTLELTHNGVCWIGVNTQIPNKIAREAIEVGRIPGLADFSELRSEVKYGQNSRVDLLGTDADGRLCYIEVKNVTLVGDDGCYQFPDAVTTRGQKHLDELVECVNQGHRAVMLFVIQRSDGVGFSPAMDIDSTYAEKLKEARTAGVEILPCMAQVSPDEVVLTGELIPQRF